MVKQRTALTATQLEQGARLVDFHGWEMPIQFAGIQVEHDAVRQACGCFDLGHMGRLRLEGPGALAFLEMRISRPLASMQVGQVRYGLICNDQGGVEDDVLVSRESESWFHVVVNAGNLAKIRSSWGQCDDGTTLTDLSQQQAMVAVQGPQSPALLTGLGLDPGDLRYFRFRDLPWNDTTVRLSRTGYTGEDGFECFLPADHAEAFWHAVTAAGARPCGLGARDTLRLEAGMPLYGNELTTTTTPVEAGLGFAVGREKTFIGSAILQAQLRDGTARRLVGLRVAGKRPARSGYDVLHEDRAVGTVTSGTRSPTLHCAIAMAYVPSELARPGQTLRIDIRGSSQAEAEVVELPFYRRER